MYIKQAFGCHRASQVNRNFGNFFVGADYFVQIESYGFVQHKTQVPVGPVFTNQHHGTLKRLSGQKGLRDQNASFFGFQGIVFDD